MNPTYSTNLGRLYQADCIEWMREASDESFDLIFADPPFNLGKMYPSGMNDSLAESTYLKWCRLWMLECVLKLKYGGSMFVWNIPKWNGLLFGELAKMLDFRHWIAVDFKSCYPIRGRLYPSHYSLLYFTKGTPKTFHPDRLPLQTCRHCFGEVHDYGGWKDKMNPNGVNLSDVWTDISPVRHSSRKNRKANELPVKLVDRIVSMASEEGDCVFDPFGGSGTTYAVCELLGRHWVGTEIGPVDGIIERLKHLESDKKILNAVNKEKNCLFSEDVVEERQRRGLWVPSTEGCTLPSIDTFHGS